MKYIDHLIIGTGFSGIAMAVKLKESGINDFAVLEKANSAGGAWRDNHYPGCACDVQSHLYSYSFSPNPNWSRQYAPQQEIKDYIENTARTHGLEPHILYNHSIKSAVYDEESSRWFVTCVNGLEFSCKVLISGVGGLHIPSIPKVKGLETFAGEAFHSADWNHDYDFKGKKVAVIGTGASAIQFVPRLANLVDQLTVFQRTAPWVLPKFDREITHVERELFNRYPLLQRALRAAIYMQLESRSFAFIYQPKLLEALEPYFIMHLKRQVKDPVLRAKVTPSFNLGCKRVLISNEYYPALTKSNVDVVTNDIREVTENSIIDARGKEHVVDAIVYGTGFKAGDSYSHIDIRGKSGRSLNDAWGSGAETFNGVNVAGFPNFYMLMGPNTGLSHNSFVYMIESQAHYIKDALLKMRKNHWKSVDVKADRQKKFVDRIQGQSNQSVWLSGCTSWYLDDKGRNWTLWPGFTFKYRWDTRRFNPSNYSITTETN